MSSNVTCSKVAIKLYCVEVKCSFIYGTYSSLLVLLIGHCVE